MIGSPQGWWWLARQKYGTILLTYSKPSIRSCHTVIMKPCPKMKESVHDRVEQEYLAYLFINNSNQKLHSQLKKDVAIN
jgi:hypothetical protein